MILILPLLIFPLLNFTTRLVFGWARVYPCAQTFAAAKIISPLISRDKALASWRYSYDPVTITTGLNPANTGEDTSVNSTKPLFKTTEFVYNVYYLLYANHP